MLQPDLVGHLRRLQVQRARLQQLESLVVERPFDFDRHPDDVFGSPQQPADLDRLRLVEARLGDERRRHGFGRRRPAVMAAADGVILAAGGDVAGARRPGPSSKRSGVTSPCAIEDPSPQVALTSIPPSAVRLNPPPEARARTSGWISTAIAVSAGSRSCVAM